MAYIVTAQKPTVVTHALTGAIAGPDDISLVVAKGTRLELHQFVQEQQEMEDGKSEPLVSLKLVHEASIYGKIVALRLFRVQGETTDRVFILTERYQYAILRYDAENENFATLSAGSVHNRVGKPQEGEQMAVIDPEARIILLHIYEGYLKVIPLSTRGVPREAFDIQLEEPAILDLAFLHGGGLGLTTAVTDGSNPTLALLYKDMYDRRRCRTITISVRDKTSSLGPLKDFDCEQQADRLVAVPAPAGGVLVFGQQTVSYHKDAICKSVPMPRARFTAVTQVDKDGARYLAGDHAGRLHVVVLAQNSSSLAENGGSTTIDTLQVDTLGETSCASCIAYLDSGVAFIGSRFGDSQLIRLLDEPLPGGDGSYVSFEQSFTNLGPIVDMCVVDVERQGQGQAVTCSGAYKDGSLRVLRNGIGINEETSSPIQGMKGMWSLRKSSQDPHDTYLVLSFISETRVFELSGADMEEMEDSPERGKRAPGFVSGRTLLAQNVGSGDLVVQVAETGVALLSADGLARVSQWEPPLNMVATVAAANESRLLIACGGGHLFHLVVDSDARVLREAARVTLEHEVACLSLNPAANTKEEETAVTAGVTPAAAAAANRDVSSALGDDDMVVVESPEESVSGARAASSSVSLSKGEAAAAAKGSGVAGGPKAALMNLNNNKGHSPKELDCLAAVGMWTDNTVRLLSLPELKPVLSQPLGGDVQARSVLLATLAGCHYLLVGLGDGHIVHYVLSLDQGSSSSGPHAHFGAGGSSTTFGGAGGVPLASLTSRKQVALGTQPLGLTCFRSGGATCVFVTGDRPTVVHASASSSSASSFSAHSTDPTKDKNEAGESASLFGGGGGGGSVAYPKLHYDNVNLSDVACVCRFHAAHFPDCFAIGTEDSLIVGTMDEMQKLHVRTIPLGEMPKRICHSEGGRVFAVVTVTYRVPAVAAAVPAAAAAAAAPSAQTDENDGGEEEELGMVRFMDEATFDAVFDCPLDPLETGCSAAACSLEGGSYVAVGTAYVREDEQEPSEGRILLFSIDGGQQGSERQVQLVAEAKTSGAVYSLHGVGSDKIVAGVNGSVCLFALRRGSNAADGGTHELAIKSTIRSQVLALFIEVRGDFILVGDLMRSVTLLSLLPESEGGGLREIARDYDAKWMAAVSMLDDDNFLGAEFDGNLFLLRKNAGASTDEERARLKQRGEFHLGDPVNRFAHGSLVMLQPNQHQQQAIGASDISTTATKALSATAAASNTAAAAAAASSASSASSSNTHLNLPLSSSNSNNNNSSNSNWVVTLEGTPVLYGSINGSIGSVLRLPDACFAWFERLQRALQTSPASRLGKGAGDLMHSEWRSVATVRRAAPASRFVDGDLIESFLELKRGTQEQIISSMLEELMREVDPATAAAAAAAAPSAAAAPGVPAAGAAAAAAASQLAAAVGPAAAAAAAALACGRLPPAGALGGAVDEVCRRVEEISRMH